MNDLVVRQQRVSMVGFVVGLAVAGALAEPALLAQEWPQWRGQTRDGQVPDFVAPSTWPLELELVWQTNVGKGYSSPVASDGRICVHTRDIDEEVVSCLDINTGEVLWSDRYSAKYTKNSYALDHGKGPNATPVIANGGLFALGMSGILSAYDVATGKLLWRADFSERVSTKKLFCGTSSSPLVDGEAVIVHVGDDVTGGMLLALDVATGEQRWKWEGSSPGYASPILVDLEGLRQLVTLTSDSVVGIAAESGELLWQIEFEDEWNENIVTPIVAGDLLIVAGVRRGTLAFRLGQQDGRWTTTELWTRADLPQYMSSPVIADGILYGFSSRQKGRLFALDLATGNSVWQSDGRLGKNASVIAAGPAHLAVLTTEGVLLFGTRTPESFEAIAEYTVSDSAPWAHPAVLGRQVAVKDASNLTLWRLADKGSESP